MKMAMVGGAIFIKSETLRKKKDSLKYSKVKVIYKFLKLELLSE